MGADAINYPGSSSPLPPGTVYGYAVNDQPARHGVTVPPGSFYGYPTKDQPKSDALPVPATHARPHSRCFRDSCSARLTAIKDAYNRVPVNAPTPRVPCCGCVIIILAGAAFYGIICLIGLIYFYIAVAPFYPKYSIQSMNITGLDGNSTTDFSIGFQLSTRNSQEVDIFYQDILVDVEMEGLTIESIIPGFHQGHKNTTVLNAPGYDLPVMQERLAHLRSQERSNFPAHVKAILNFRIPDRSCKFKSKFSCNVKVNLMMAGTPIVYKHCKVQNG